MSFKRSICQYAFPNTVKRVMEKHKDNACYSHEYSHSEFWRDVQEYSDYNEYYEQGLPGWKLKVLRTICKIVFPNTVKRIQEEYESQMLDYIYCDEEDDKDDIKLVPSKHGMHSTHFINDMEEVDEIRELAWEKIENNDNGKYIKFRSNKHHGCRPIVAELCCSRMYRPRNVLEKEATRIMKKRGWDDQSIQKYLKSICDIFYIESIGDKTHRLVEVNVGFFGWLRGESSIKIRKMEDYDQTMYYFWGHKEQGK